MNARRRNRTARHAESLIIPGPTFHGLLGDVAVPL